MGSESYELSEISASGAQNPGDERRNTRWRGCYVNYVAGIILALLSVAIAGCVGLVVYYVGCNFSCHVVPSGQNGLTPTAHSITNSRTTDAYITETVSTRDKQIQTTESKHHGSTVNHNTHQSTTAVHISSTWTKETENSSQSPFSTSASSEAPTTFPYETTESTACRCPSGYDYTKHGCYKFYMQEENWNLSRARCLGDSAHQVAIETRGEMETLRQLMSRNGVGSYLFWTGGNRLGSDVWIWDGVNVNVTYTYWYPGYPVGGDCMWMYTSKHGHRWGSLDCLPATARTVCEV